MDNWRGQSKLNDPELYNQKWETINFSNYVNERSLKTSLSPNSNNHLQQKFNFCVTKFLFFVLKNNS